jgi:hypothetical protein
MARYQCGACGFDGLAPWSGRLLCPDRGYRTRVRVIPPRRGPDGGRSPDRDFGTIRLGRLGRGRVKREHFRAFGPEFPGSVTHLARWYQQNASTRVVYRRKLLHYYP